MSQQAIDLVFELFDADRRPGTQPATLIAIAERVLAQVREEERERCRQAAIASYEQQEDRGQDCCSDTAYAIAVAIRDEIPPPAQE